jgi:hypothetical protein
MKPDDLTAQQRSRLQQVDWEAFSALADAIIAGDCVGFLGAGFSAVALPSWDQLIAGIAEQPEVKAALEEKGKLELVRYLRAGGGLTSDRYPQAAQVLFDALGEERFGEALNAAIDRDISTEDREVLDRRVSLLSGIPFRAVLTTNFDRFPGGAPRGPRRYAEVLRPHAATGRQWWSQRHREAGAGPTRIALHGSIPAPDGPNPVLTRRQYRSLLYETPGYLSFLRAAFATTTVLFLGSSLSDEYLNEVRSEVLALVGHDPVIAYAVIHAAKVSPGEAEYLRDHEGLQVLRYGDPETPGDHRGFDALLAALHQATNFYERVGRKLAGMRILWFDANPANSWGSRDVALTIQELEARAGAPVFVRTDDFETTLDALRTPDHGIDLVITYWGYIRSEEYDAWGLRLLRQMRSEGIEVPVIVYAHPRYVDENRPYALRAGATDYIGTVDDLYRRIHDLCAALRPERAD